MIITHYFRFYDRPIYIHYLSVFVNCLSDDFFTELDRMNLRLFDDYGKLIGRAAFYNGVSYA